VSIAARCGPCGGAARFITILGAKSKHYDDRTAMTERTYLDWNATSPLRPEARAAALAALAMTGNPSSVHAEGRAARQLVAQARAQVAALVGAEPSNLVFTSGGSEANAMALTPGLGADRDGVRGCDHLLVSAIEHPSVAAGGRFEPTAIDTIPVTGEGQADLSALERKLAALAAQGLRPLVSIMLANNETGVIQPVAEAGRMAHAAGALLHVDAVQACGRIHTDINCLNADLLTISGHKIGAPPGVGALVRRSARLSFGRPLIGGGGQERGLRAGTENVPAIAAFGAAAAAAARNLEREQARVIALRDQLETGLLAVSPQTVIFGSRAERVANTVLFAVPGIKAEVALIALDLEGIALSSGAACSSGKVTPSHVLSAMGVEAHLARCALRASFGFSTSQQDIDRLLQAWRMRVQALPNGQQGIAA
jgi:cysteine desulfurase